MNLKRDNTNLIFDTANCAFEYLYNHILANGEDTNIGTKAVYNVGFYIINPTLNSITSPWRKWSEKYAHREWAWYLSGNPSVEDIKKYAPIWDKMHGGDNIVNSNYGYQWMRNEQLRKCIEQLRSDSNTRQAWISIFDGKEKDKYAYDTPCTIAVGFNIPTLDPDRLNMTVIMRSNDLIYGFCNDQFCFSQLQKMVANELGLQVGTFYHFAHNLHIYKQHFNLKSDYEKTKTVSQQS